MPLFSIRENSQLIPGEFIQPYGFCLKNCGKGKCKAFYDSLVETGKIGFFTCPYGMSVYYSSERIIYSCMRVKGSYDRELIKRIPNKEKELFNPVMPSKQALALIMESDNRKTERNLLDEKRASVESISHEVKQLNAQIKDKSSLILASLKLDEDGAELSEDVLHILQNEIRTIYVSSSMIATRFSMYDYEKNPASLVQGAKVSSVVYKKFDKIRKIFKNYLGRGIVINLNGSSYDTIMTYPLFDMIPLLLIENAVKYTYDSSNTVDIYFSKPSENELTVKVCSYSPYCSKEDISKLFEKGFRGKNAKKVSAGAGIGLYFVKLLCDAHDIGISAKSNEKSVMNINGIPYALFELTLNIKDTFTDYF